MEATGLPVTLHRGPAHITEYVDPRLAEQYADRQLIGVPAREAWTEPCFAQLQALMDKAFMTGERQRIPWLDGTYCAVPLREGGRIVGVATMLVPLRSPHPQSPPEMPRRTTAERVAVG